MGVHVAVVGDEDVQQLVQLNDPGDDEELGCEGVLGLPDGCTEDEDGDVESGPVEEVGQAQSS